MSYTIIVISLSSIVLIFIGEERKRAFVTWLVEGLIGVIPQFPFFILGILLADWCIHGAEQRGWFTPAQTEQSPKSMHDGEESSSEEEEEEEEDEFLEDEEEEPPVRSYTLSNSGGCHRNVFRHSVPEVSPLV